MSVLNPALLWGLLGVSVPIAIHLLNRFRYREVRWAAMDLLRKALVVRSRRVRIEDLILLALRCLVVLFAALALARPTITPRGAMWLASASGTGAVIAIDGSFSMEHRPGVRSRFEQALDRTREVAATLTPGAPVSLVLLGAQPRVLLRNVGLDPEGFEMALQGMAPLPERLDLEAALEEIEDLAAEIRASGRECHVLTDAQASTWAEPSARVRDAFRSITEKARVFVLPVGAEGDENLAIAGLEHVSGAPRVGAVGRFRAEVKNTGSRPRENVAVTLLVDGTSVDARTIDRIAPGAVVEAALFARFDREGSVAVEARLDADPLPADDSRHLVVEIRNRTRVLCVDPAAGSFGGLRGETGIIAAALSARSAGTEPAAVVETIGPAELAAADFTGADIVVLANVSDVLPAVAGMLRNFVVSGGGLIVFLGDAIEPNLANARFRSEDADLLPAEIGEEAASELSIVAEAAGHPLAAALRALKPEILDEARVHRWFRVRLAEDARPILTLSGSGDVLLAERAVGRGKVLLFTTSADGAWNDLFASPVYPILLQEAVRHLTRTGNERPLTVGDAIAVALPPEIPGDEVVFRNPAGTSFPVTVERGDGLRLARRPPAALPGIHAIEAPAGDRRILVAVNVDINESKVAALDAPGLARAIEAPGVRVIAPGENVAAAVREGRTGRELWRELVVAAIALLALESFLGRRFARLGARGGAA